MASQSPLSTMLAEGSPKGVEESIHDAEKQLKSLSDTGHDDNDPYEVVLEPSEDPLNLSTLRKWLTVLIISAGSLCVTSMSSIVGPFPVLAFAIFLRLSCA